MRRWGAVRPGDWTKGQIALLRELAGTMRAREIAPRVGHTRMATQAKIFALGLPAWKWGNCMDWTPEQLEALQRIPVGMSARQFAEQHGMSEMAVYHRARRLGVIFQPATMWRVDEVETLRRLAATHTLPQTAAEMGRSYKSVQVKALSLKLVFQPCRRRTGRPRAEKKPARAPRPEKAPKPAKAPKAASKQPVRVQAAVRKTTAGGGSLRRKEVRGTALEWCRCGAPVSNWDEHFARRGHRRDSMLRDGTRDGGRVWECAG